MLIHTKELEGYEIHGQDGTIGHVTDLYFDEQQWGIRYVVVDTGSWLHRHQVLLSPSMLKRDPLLPRGFRVEATREQVRNSPEIDSVRTASREQERALHDHYGWPYYWAATPLPGGMYGLSPTSPPAPPAGPVTPVERPLHAAVESPTLETESHLWSVHEIRGYTIHATDGEIGHLDDLLVEDGTWSVRFLMVDTRNWLPGKRVVIRPRRLERVSWPERTVFVSLPRELIKNRPEFDPNQPGVSDYSDRPLGTGRPQQNRPPG